MILGIDASNIRGGGGVTHLVELLRVAAPEDSGFSRVVVWGGLATLRQIDDRPWLMKSRQPLLDGRLMQRTLWQCFRLSALARRDHCDVLFVPGGSFSGDFSPFVAMSQNLLPFEWTELRRYGVTPITVRLLLLRWTQSRSFRRANGVIFLTNHACDVVARAIKATAAMTTVVPHGVADRFTLPPREQLGIEQYSAERPFRVIYVSVIDVYKHQWNVAEAIAQLRADGVPVTLSLIGPAFPPALERLTRVLDRLDPARAFVEYVGAVSYQDLPSRYARADLAIFASSCENMPLILLEAMASGLPIICSKRGPMPEVLGDAGVYCDPENSGDIARALRELITAPSLRAEKAQQSFARARVFSWQACARGTFGFLARVARGADAGPPGNVLVDAAGNGRS